MSTELDRDVIPPELAIRAMRDSGYKNTAYALAELIDNSVQAKAHNVELICLDRLQQIKERSRQHLYSIGVLDDGEGMTAETLRVALQFGNGTHLDDRSGIGRFGMGLPNSSISQCRRLEVWTWQSGPDNAMYSYLDVTEIESGELKKVPLPVHQPLPAGWRTRTQALGTTGTLIVWSNFEEYRLSWRGSRSTLENTEVLIGRMYRKFIDRGHLKIRLVAFSDDVSVPTYDKVARVNDPLYLMSNSSTPPPFDSRPMFQRAGEKDWEFPISMGGSTHKIVVRVSWALEETVPEDTSERGSKPYGKHAGKNIGVSIVREGRELDLDSGWTNNYDPVERWWGIEVEFPSALDEVFGVTNTKQNANRFSQMAHFDWKSEAKPDETRPDLIARLQEEGDPRAILDPVAKYVREQIDLVRTYLKRQTEGRRSRQGRHDEPSVEDLATTKFTERAESGHVTESDEQQFTEKDRVTLEEDLVEDKQYSRDVAKEISEAVLRRNRKVIFLTKAMDGYGFFNVEHQPGGLTAIVFNTNHPFHGQLTETLRPETGQETEADLLGKIYKAADTIELLFAAWARYEMEEVDHKEALFDMRQEWGKMAKYFLSEKDGK